MREHRLGFCRSFWLMVEGTVNTRRLQKNYEIYKYQSLAWHSDCEVQASRVFKHEEMNSYNGPVNWQSINRRNNYL
jgi:hypothetical protein